MKSAIYFDLDNTLTDRNASIDAFAKRFIAHFSNELSITNVDKVSQIIREQDNGGYLDKLSPIFLVFLFSIRPLNSANSFSFASRTIGLSIPVLALWYLLSSNYGCLDLMFPREIRDRDLQSTDWLLQSQIQIHF